MEGMGVGGDIGECGGASLRRENGLRDTIKKNVVAHSRSSVYVELKDLVG